MARAADIERKALHERRFRRFRDWVSGSLTVRVIILSSLLATVSLVLITAVIATLYRNAAEENFDNLLSANLFNLIGSVGPNAEGQMVGSPDFGDLRYSEPGSGWYWEVDLQDAEGQTTSRLRSSSMVNAVEVPSTEEVPFGPEYERGYIVDDPSGGEVRVAETELVVGPELSLARFRVMGSQDGFERGVSQFRNTLIVTLALFGLGTVAINALVILFGLRPLSEARQALLRIRKGQADRVEGTFPSEIAPMVGELNALIETNREVMERARTQVGNLAHSLKTPLAILRNEASSLGGDTGPLIEEQTEAMRQQVEHYLQRARVAAQRASLVYRTDPAPIAERLTRVMAKLFPDKTFTTELGDRKTVFAGEERDLEEMLGNLLENAAKWSERNVRLAIRPAAETSGDTLRFIVAIDDDGPGIPEGQMELALGRGKRLDENVPGTGLGLSIVSEMASDYGGHIELHRSDLGGLSARLFLPAIDMKG